MTVTASLLLGAFVGAINAVAAAWTARIAMAGEPGKALHLVLGGMVARMVVILGTVAAVLEDAVRRGLNPADIDAAESEAYANGKGQKFYKLYQDRLKALNACDFGDLLLHMLNIFRKEREVLAQYQQRFKYIMVDEYQDTNAVQYLWLRLLAQERKNICVVGDDDQSIYSWRGAEVANILRFEKDFPGCKVVKLEQNYRSSGRILKCANILIANNPHVYDKALFSELGYGVELRVLQTKNEENEVERLVGELIGHRFINKSQFKDYAVLRSFTRSETSR